MIFYVRRSVKITEGKIEIKNIKQNKSKQKKYLKHFMGKDWIVQINKINRKKEKKNHKKLNQKKYFDRFFEKMRTQFFPVN